MILLLFLAVAFTEPEPMQLDSGESIAVYQGRVGGDRPAILVPGLGGSAYGFRKLAPLLEEQGYRIIVVEPLGVGLSDRPASADYTLTAQSRRLGEVLERLEVRDALIVAQGISGSITMRLALHRPDLVRAIVSIEGGPAESAATATVQHALKLARLVSNLGGDSLLKDRYEEDLKTASGDTSWVDRRTLNRYFRGPGRDVGATLDVFAAMNAQREPERLAPRLPEINQPILVLMGGAAHAGALDPVEVQTLRAGLPRVSFEVVPDVGHFMYEEDPRAVADAVRRFDAP
ncbi:MAG: alpha/beta hydrolase [Candidatus Krumholzibacteriia bacterium]